MKDGTGIQMSKHRVAIKPLLCLFLWSTTHAVQTVSARGDFEFSRELAQFVPECASNCFVAFLNSHFSQASCSESTLDCLCTGRGAGGFTVGEGAVQCVEAEQQVGLCRDEGLGADAPQRAYFMCSGQRNAAQPTHTALEATFVRTGTAGGVVIAPPATETSSSTTTSTRSLPATLITATSSLTFSTSTRPFETRSTASTSTFAPAPTAEPESEPDERQPASAESSEDDGGFGTQQVIGLAVGVSGAIGLLLAVFLIARCRRKKRLDAAGPLDVSEKFAPTEPRRRPNERSIIHISPPLPGRSPAIPPPPVHSRGTMWPDAMSMARSRPQSRTPSNLPSPHYRRASKLLPPKPTAARPFLNVEIPNIKLTDSPPERQQGLVSGNLPPPVRRSDRNSAMTEFEEDGILSAYANSQPTSQIWRPPQSDPRSATTYYVADGSGNWVLGRPELPRQAPAAAEMDAGASAAQQGPLVPVINTTVASQVGIGHGKGSPIAPPAPQSPARPSAAANLLPAANIMNAAGQPMSRSSSVYSSDKQAQAQAARAAAAAAATVAHNVPAMSFSHPEPPRRRSNSVKNNSNRKGHERGESQDGLLRHGSYKSHGSKDSVTTLASSAGGVTGEDDPGRVLDQNLSPVVESPEAIAEQSHRRSQTQVPQMYGLGLQVRPPPVRAGHVSPPPPPGQPGPFEWPDSGPVHQMGENRRVNQPPARNPGMMMRPDPSQFKTGSPNLPTVRMVPASNSSSMTSPYPSPLRPQRPPMHRGPAPYAPHPQAATPAQYGQPGRPVPPAGGQPRYMAYRPPAAGIHQALWGQGPPAPNDNIYAPREQSWRPQPNRQPRPDENLDQLQHQLRQPNVQRDGPYPHHIASQQRRPSIPASGHSGGSASWSSSSSSLAAKRIGSERAAALAVQTGGGRGGDQRWRPWNGDQQSGGGLSSDGQMLAPPQSAGWQPRLTPTRRGDDLFLHLQ